MSATACIIGDTVHARFSAPWDIDGHELFLKSKRLPEAKCEFDRLTDSYTISAPSRFAHFLGLTAPTVKAHALPLSDFLFDYQRWCVEIALEAKRFALWEDCGLGKTPQALEWSRQVSHRTGFGRVAILAPKQLFGQWVDEVEKFYGSNMSLLVIKSKDELVRWCKGEFMPHETYAIASHHLFVDGPIDEMRNCAGVVLEESSILKGGGGVIKWNLIKSCRGIEYKLSCTATPAPNDTIEYASQASFLEKLRNEGEILWTFFVRDAKTQEWKVRPHAKEAFYRFMSAWSIYLRRPSAYGFEDKFDLPEPEIVEHKLSSTSEQLAEAVKFARRNGELLNDERLGVTARSKLSQIAKGFIYKTDKSARRIASLKPTAVAQLIASSVLDGRRPLCWTVFDEESEIIMERLQYLGVEGVESLHGKDSESERERKLEAYRHGQCAGLVSKARLLGYGMNFQFCSSMVFSGFDDSFEQFYQAVRRAHRYGATERLTVHVPYIPSLESHMWNNLLRKKNQWETDIATQEANYAAAMKSLLKSITKSSSP